MASQAASLTWFLVPVFRRRKEADGWALSETPVIAASDRSSISDAMFGGGGGTCQLHIVGLQAKSLQSSKVSPAAFTGQEDSQAPSQPVSQSVRQHTIKI